MQHSAQAGNDETGRTIGARWSGHGERSPKGGRFAFCAPELHSAPVAVDWFRLLWDLIQRGHNLQTVADLTGIGRTTLRGYLADSQPPHWRGERLLTLWCLTCDKPRDQAPTVELSLSPRVVHSRADVQPAAQAVAALSKAWR